MIISITSREGVGGNDVHLLFPILRLFFLFFTFSKRENESCCRIVFSLRVEWTSYFGLLFINNDIKETDLFSSPRNSSSEIQSQAEMKASFFIHFIVKCIIEPTKSTRIFVQHFRAGMKISKHFDRSLVIELEPASITHESCLKLDSMDSAGLCDSGLDDDSHFWFRCHSNEIQSLFRLWRNPDSSGS